jgi:hypothetical protein
MAVSFVVCMWLLLRGDISGVCFNVFSATQQATVQPCYGACFNLASDRGRALIAETGLDIAAIREILVELHTSFQ